MSPLLLATRHLRRRRVASRRLRVQRFRQQQQRRRLKLVLAMLGVIFFQNRFIVERNVWVKERSGYCWDRIVLTSFSDEQWRANFRMSHAMFYYLCNELRPEIIKQDTRFRRAVSVEKRVAITLWRLATNGDYRSVGHMFGVAKGTVCVI